MDSNSIGGFGPKVQTVSATVKKPVFQSQEYYADLYEFDIRYFAYNTRFGVYAKDCYVSGCPCPTLTSVTLDSDRIPTKENKGRKHMRHFWHGGTSGTMNRRIDLEISAWPAIKMVAKMLELDITNHGYWLNAKAEMEQVLQSGFKQINTDYNHILSRLS